MKTVEKKNDNNVASDMSASTFSGERVERTTLTAVSGDFVTGSDTDIDPTKLRLSQNFVEMSGVQRVVTSIPIRKPTRQEFVRVRDGERSRMEVAILELKDERETYIVNPDLYPLLADELTPVVLRLTINRQDVPFLWPIRLPDANGRLNSWHDSDHQASEIAVEKWVRIAANMSAGGYDLFVATGELPDPKWPAMEFKEILNLAFRGRIIESMDHSVLRRLRGEQQHGPPIRRGSVSGDMVCGLRI